MLWAWWIALHGVVLVAFALLAAPWAIKSLALLATVAHAAAFRPRATPRLVWRGDGRIAVPELELYDLSLGPRSRHSALWIRLDLRAGGRALDILLVADQLDAAAWRSLRSELNRLRIRATPADPGGDPGPDLR